MIERITEQPFCQTRVMCWAVDNLELLLSQPDESVDLIYCDILYGTGRKFKDYQDLKPIRIDIEAHYIPRIKEMHRILKPTGSIYLQMDTRINHWMRFIMDDAFGYDNFRSEIVWGYNGRQKYNALKFQGKHDVILFYSKTEKHKLNDIKIEWERESRLKVMRRKILIDDNGLEYFIDNRGVANGTPKKKVILSEYLNKGGSLSDLWCDISIILGTDNQKLNYDTQKPKALIERIIKASSNEGDIVADYYLGSGTTAVVCKELNRNFIGCDINPKAIEITNARLEALS